MRQFHLIISNAALMWVTQVLLVFPPLILVPYLIGTIGEAGYGVYALVWSLMMSIEQLQRSLQSGVVKYSAGFLAQGQMDKVNSVVSSSFVYSLLLAVLACAGTLFAAAFYKDPSGQIGSALIVVGIMVLFIFPLTPYIAVIQSRQRYYVGAIAETVSRYISLFIVIAWFRVVGPSVEALIIIMAAMVFISRLAQVPIAHCIVPGLQNRPNLFNGKIFRLIGAFGVSTVVASLCLVANTTGVRWLMGSLVSPSFVTHLAIILMPIMFLSQIIGAMTITVMPATSAYEATGNQRMLQELLIRGMRYTTILILAGLLVAGLLMRNVLSAWVGPDYAFLAPYAMTLFACNAFMLSTSIGHHMLKGMGKLRAVIFIYAIGLVIVPIGLILAVFYIWHNPYVSVTVGLSTGYLACGCFQIVYCTKTVHANLGGVFVRVYVQPLIVTVAVCLVAVGLVAASEIDGLFGRACVSLFALLLSFWGCYAFIATTEERQQVKGVVQLVKSKITSNRRKSKAN